MSMENIECEVFCYEENEFERDIMRWFKPIPAMYIKMFIDEELESKPSCFRKAVYKRILNFKNEKDWFISMRELTQLEKEQECEELFAIWKIGIQHAKDYYLSCYESNQHDEEENEDEDEERPKLLRAIDSWFFKTLTEFDTELEKGKINEQEYITRCNNMKNHKKITEDLLTVCLCSAIGRQNKARIGDADTYTNMFRIICMPCGFLG